MRYGVIFPKVGHPFEKVAPFFFFLLLAFSYFGSLYAAYHRCPSFIELFFYNVSILPTAFPFPSL